MPLVTRSSTFGNVYKSAIEPAGWVDGDLWSDTTTDTVFKNVGGVAKIIGVKAALIYG